MVLGIGGRAQRGAAEVSPVSRRMSTHRSSGAQDREIFVNGRLKVHENDVPELRRRRSTGVDGSTSAEVRFGMAKPEERVGKCDGCDPRDKPKPVRAVTHVEKPSMERVIDAWHCAACNPELWADPEGDDPGKKPGQSRRDL